MTPSIETLEERAHRTCIATVMTEVRSLIGARAWRVRGSLAIDIHLRGALGRRPGDIDLDIETQSDERPLFVPGDRKNGMQVVRCESVRFTRSMAGRRVDRVLVEVGGEERPERRLLLGVTYRRLDQPESHSLPLRPHLGPTVPVLSLERCIAEKLLRYGTPRSSGRVNTKWVDMFDLLTVAARAPGLRSASMKAALESQSRDWAVDVPLAVPQPPVEWLDYWDGAMFQYGLGFGRLNEAYCLLRDFVGPIFHSADATSDMSWDADAWTWRPDADD